MVCVGLRSYHSVTVAKIDVENTSSLLAFHASILHPCVMSRPCKVCV